MADAAGNPAKVPFLRDRSGFVLALLLGFHVIICCVSLTYVAYFYRSPVIVAFSSARIGPAILIAAPFALTAVLFAVSRFSFGYFLGFCLYTVILGYLWLVEFSVFPYEHRWPAVSAAFSGLFFLLPALMTASPFPQAFTLSPRAFDRAADGDPVRRRSNRRGRRALQLQAGRDRRDLQPFAKSIHFPAPLGYAIGATSMVLLPFAFAGFLMRGRALARGGRARADAAVLSGHPDQADAVCAVLAVVPDRCCRGSPRSGWRSCCRSPRRSRSAWCWAMLYKAEVLPYEVAFPFFGALNFRMIAVPSLAIDIYNDFFATHPVTHFCQISVLKAVRRLPLWRAAGAADGQQLRARQSQRLAVCDRRRRIRRTARSRRLRRWLADS